MQNVSSPGKFYDWFFSRLNPPVYLEIHTIDSFPIDENKYPPQKILAWKNKEMVVNWIYHARKISTVKIRLQPRKRWHEKIHTWLAIGIFMLGKPPWWKFRFYPCKNEHEKLKYGGKVKSPWWEILHGKITIPPQEKTTRENKYNVVYRSLHGGKLSTEE